VAAFIWLYVRTPAPRRHVADGATTAFAKAGDRGDPASPRRLNELVGSGGNIPFDLLPSGRGAKDLTFTFLDATFKRFKKITLAEKDYVSFGISRPDGELTYAGLKITATIN
jgi:hypothetical protein